MVIKIRQLLKNIPTKYFSYSLEILKIIHFLLYDIGFLSVSKKIINAVTDIRTVISASIRCMVLIAGFNSVNTTAPPNNPTMMIIERSIRETLINALLFLCLKKILKHINNVNIPTIVPTDRCEYSIKA